MYGLIVMSVENGHIKPHINLKFIKITFVLENVQMNMSAILNRSIYVANFAERNLKRDGAARNAFVR